jgi:hypothetical protein
MASIITATTTSGLTQSADNSGVLQLASGVGNLVTVPAVTGTAMVSGAMPAFSVYSTTGQSIGNNTTVKIQLNTEVFDTNNNFDSTTNYRFTPTVAGYYQINGQIALNGSASGTARVAIFKNGTNFAEGCSVPNNTITGAEATVSSIIYFNGSTDYVELYCYLFTGAGALTTQNSSAVNYFNGAMVRSA